MSEPRILEIFREEAAERLDRMVDVLLTVEDGRERPDALDVLFREAHSLKGNAGLAGVEEVRATAHAVEDVLAGLRDRGGTIPAAAAARLLQAADAMRRAALGEEGVTRAALEALGEPDRPPAAKAPEPPRAAPLGASIRVPAANVDQLLDAVGESVLAQRRLEHGLGEEADEDLRETVERGELLAAELQHSVLALRAMPVAVIARAFPRFVRDLAVAEGKEVELAMEGTDTRLDRSILEGLSESLVHVLRNAVAHGIEPPQERITAGKPARGRIELRVEQRGARVAVEVADDGRGVARELLGSLAGGSLADSLARAGFSTAREVTDVAGRGVGLDAVKAHVESLGGGLAVESEPGRGTTVSLVLPLTLAVLHVLLVERGGQVFALPAASVAEVVPVAGVLRLGGRRSLELHGSPVPLGDLAAALGAPTREIAEGRPALVVTHSGRTVALACDRLLGDEEVTLKTLGPALGRLPGYLGAALLADGRIALIVDPATVTSRDSADGDAAAPEPAAPRGPASVLVVDDQLTVRELQRSILETAGYRVETARDGREALERLTGEGEVDVVVTDVQMPELDGLGLLHELRADPALASLPVVMVSSRSSEEDRRRGLEAGADAYVAKDGFDQRALLDTIERLVGR